MCANICDACVHSLLQGAVRCSAAHCQPPPGTVAPLLVYGSVQMTDFGLQFVCVHEFGSCRELRACRIGVSGWGEGQGERVQENEENRVGL